MLDAKIVDKVTQEVLRNFPEMKGVTPQIRRSSNQPPAQEETETNSKSVKFLLTYQNQTVLATAKHLPRWVRVTVNASGKILKMTTSR